MTCLSESPMSLPTQFTTLFPYTTLFRSRSTTPTMAESIAAPCSPVAAVEALHPSCTTRTRSPIPASTESSASRVAPHSRSEEHTSELQSRQYLVCRLLLENKNQQNKHR